MPNIFYIMNNIAQYCTLGIGECYISSACMAQWGKALDYGSCGHAFEPPEDIYVMHC